MNQKKNKNILNICINGPSPGMRSQLIRELGSRSGFIARRLWHPNPWLIPARLRQIDVSRPGALGDVLMCTPGLREVKRVNPDCKIRFHTKYPSLVEGLPYIDEVVYCEVRPDNAIRLAYEDVIPPRRHIARIMGDCLGVRVTDVRPDCSVCSELVQTMARRWDGLPRPRVVINRCAGPWTPNKDWPDTYWNHLVDQLMEWATVIEIGSQTYSTAEKKLGERYVDLRGQTTLDELIATIAAADLHVGPISGPVHIAAAVRTPSVVIYGGYEHPVCTEYPGNVSLYSPIHCAPCWLRDPCPFGLKCLSMISYEQVNESISDLWKRTRLRNH
jgi:ADP-heptose:LPS heptosyltransferase